MRDLGKGIASIGVSAAVIGALYLTKDVNALWGLAVIPFIYRVS